MWHKRCTHNAAENSRVSCKLVQGRVQQFIIWTLSQTFCFQPHSSSMKIDLARLRRQHISMEKYKTITYQVLFVGIDDQTGCNRTQRGKISRHHTLCNSWPCGDVNILLLQCPLSWQIWRNRQISKLQQMKHWLWHAMSQAIHIHISYGSRVQCQ